MQNAAAMGHQMFKLSGVASFRTCSGLSVLFSSHSMSAPPLYSALFAVIESSLEHELLYHRYFREGLEAHHVSHRAYARTP